MKMTNIEKRALKRNRRVRKKYFKIFYKDVKRALATDCPKTENGDLFKSLEILADDPVLLLKADMEEKHHVAEVVGRFIKLKNPETCVKYKVNQAVTEWIDSCDDMTEQNTVSLTLYLNSI